MAGRLQGKVALVNGGGGKGDGWGNGKATAVQFAREGARVVIADIDAEAAAATAEIIRREGGEAMEVIADVASEADMARAVRAAVDAHGRLDILMQVVGVGGPGDFLTETEDALDRVLRINLKGAFFACREAVKAMLPQGSGSIITVSSHHGIVAAGRGTAFSYGMSKAALRHMTRMLAHEYAPRGLRANCITVGMLDTPMVSRGYRDRAEEVRKLRDAASPTGRQGTGWDTAFAATYLASDEASYINGLDLVIDGGLTVGTVPVFRTSD